MLTLEQKSTNSPKDDQAVKVAKHRINKGGYLYKNIEERYLKTVEEKEKEKIERILEERHKLMQNPTISVLELKHHWTHYKQQLLAKKHESEQKRLEDVKKNKEVSEWLQLNIKKTRFHQIVETECSPE